MYNADSRSIHYVDLKHFRLGPSNDLELSVSAAPFCHNNSTSEDLQLLLDQVWVAVGGQGEEIEERRKCRKIGISVSDNG